MWVEALGLFMSLIYNQLPVTRRAQDVEESLHVPLPSRRVGSRNGGGQRRHFLSAPISNAVTLRRKGVCEPTGSPRAGLPGSLRLWSMAAEGAVGLQVGVLPAHVGRARGS